MLIRHAEEIIENFNVMLSRNPRVFAYQLFYSHNAVFTIHCLIRYKEQNPVRHIVFAIDLLFGDNEAETKDLTFSNTKNPES